MRDRTGHKSNALLRKPGTEQVLKVSECLGVPRNLNLSKDNVALAGMDGTGVAETMQSESAFDESECHVPHELLASIDERSFAQEEFKRD